MTAIIIAVLVVLLILIIVKNIYVVQQSRAYVIERLGAFSKVWGVGLHLKMPFFERVAKKVSLKELYARSDVISLHCPLTAENTGLIVICGRNAQLYERLQQRYGDQIILVGKPDQMAAYMRACDLMFTKPGGLTSTEAAVAGIPLVHITPIPGCETKNRAYFEQHGMSLLAHTPVEAVEALRLLQDSMRCQQMIARQRMCINANASSDICDLAERLAKIPS